MKIFKYLGIALGVSTLLFTVLAINLYSYNYFVNGKEIVNAN